MSTDTTLLALRVGVPVGILAFAIVALRAGRHRTGELDETMVIAPVGPRPHPSVLVQGPHGRRRIEVARELVVGRGPDADIHIDDTFASTRHALLERRGGELWITDLGSTNGTLVDGETLGAPSRLRPGSVITVGDTRIEVAP